MPIIKTVGIISKPNSPRPPELVPELIEWLNDRGITVRVDEQTGVLCRAAGRAFRANESPKAATW